MNRHGSVYSKPRYSIIISFRFSRLSYQLPLPCAPQPRTGSIRSSFAMRWPLRLPTWFLLLASHFRVPLPVAVASPTLLTRHCTLVCGCLWTYSTYCTSVLLWVLHNIGTYISTLCITEHICVMSYHILECNLGSVDDTHTDADDSRHRYCT